MDTQKLLSLLNSCITSKSLRQGKILHQKIVSFGLQNNSFYCKHLINLYFACHVFDSAELAFKTLECPLDISLWNGLIAAYTKNQMYHEALHFFEKLRHFPYLKPDNYTYPSVLKAFGGLGNGNEGKKVHTLVIKDGCRSDIVVASSLLGMYAKCNLLDFALQVFDEMTQRDVASWNAVISCYYQKGQSEKALEMYEEMSNSGFQPDSVTFTVALSACSKLWNLQRGKEIHGELMRSGFQLDPFVSSALVDMYGKCGCLDKAREVFEQMPIRKNVVCWNSMITGYSVKGDSNSCLELFRSMIKEGLTPTATTVSSLLMALSKSAKLCEGKALHGFSIRNAIEEDMFVQNSLIYLYFKCESVAVAERIFERRLVSKSNVVCWNVMISGYVMTGCYLEALAMLSGMGNTGVKPDAVTFTSVLSACSQLAALEKGREIHQQIIDNELESNEIVMGALLDMYAKCGAVEDARRVFDQLPERDFVSWTCMITAYGSHGQALQALQIFHEMEKSKAKPDSVTFLAILSACSHSGLIGEGLRFFNLMTRQYGIRPSLEHYSCLIDLVGRFGNLREAYNILQSTGNLSMDVGLLSTLFCACNMHGDLDLGEEIARVLFEKDPNDPSTYIVLSNMYASVGRWNDVRKVRLKMKELRLKKNPGCSWIELDKRIHPFYVEDKTHSQADMIYCCLENLKKQMEDEEHFLLVMEEDFCS